MKRSRHGDYVNGINVNLFFKISSYQGFTSKQTLILVSQIVSYAIANR